MNLSDQVAALEKDWADNPRWKHVKRPYTAEEVVKLRGSLQPECTLARKGAEKLWNEINNSDFWFMGISPEGIGSVGMLLNFIIALSVSSLTKPPPDEVLELVDDIRRP